MNQKYITCSFHNNKMQSTHYHYEHEILYVLEGSLDLTVSNDTHHLEADSFYLINTGCSHEWKSTTNVLLGCLHIPFDVITEYFPAKEILFLCSSDSMSNNSVENLRKIICKIFTYSYHQEGDGKILYTLACTQLLYFLSTNCLAPKSNPLRNLPSEEYDKRAYELVKYISENYETELRLSDVAKHFHLSTPYLSKYFKDYFGVNFLAYLRNLRLDYSMQDLLYTNKTISQISIDNGFPNINSFSDSFKGKYEITPTEYRKKNIPQNTADTSKGAQDSDNTISLRKEVEISLQNMQKVDPTEQFYSTEEIKISNYSAVKNFFTPQEKMICIGNSINLLRYDVREQLSYLSKELNFEYAYINNLLHPSMKISIDKENDNYNFTEIRKVLDYIISLDMHPYIELESQQMTPSLSDSESLLSANTKSNMDQMYKNHSLFDSFLSFLLKRYGIDELSHWYFSLERSTATNNCVDEENYFHYFASLYNKIKARIPGAKVGGPGFTINFDEDYLENFIKNWKRTGQTPDFINMYVFPYVYDSNQIFSLVNKTSPNRDYLENAMNHINNVIHRSALWECELHITIWNSTLSTHNHLNDSCHKSSYIMRNIINTWDLCNIIGYWGPFDIGMNDEDDKKTLFGGTGLLSQNDLRKPALHAYAFLHQLMPLFVSRSEHSIVTKNKLGRYAICCHNYKHYNALFYQKSEEELKIDEFSLLFEDQEALHITITISDLPEGAYWIKKRFVNESNGNIQSSWIALNQFSELTQPETNFLKAQSEPGLLYKREICTHGTITIDEVLEPHEIVLWEIESEM